MTDNNSKNTTVSGGISFTGLLTIVFIVLKLLNIINWSWWWVLAPPLVTCWNIFNNSFNFYYYRLCNE